MSLKLDDDGHFARGQVARYQEVIDDQIHKIPIKTPKEAAVVRSALTILSQGTGNCLAPFEQANDPSLNDLKERVEELADIVTHPEEMLDPSFAPDQTERLGEIFRQRVGFQANKIEQPDQLEQSVKDRETERAAAAAYRETIKHKAPPPPGSEAHTVSYEEMLRQQWGERPTSINTSSLPDWLFEMATPHQQITFNSTAALRGLSPSLRSIPFPAEPPENIATKRAYLAIAKGFHFYLGQFGLTVNQALEIGADRMNSYLVSSTLRTLALTVISERLMTFNDFNRLSDAALAIIRDPINHSTFCDLVKHLGIDTVVNLHPERLKILITKFPDALFLAERGLLKTCLALNESDLLNVLKNSPHISRNIGIAHVSIEELVAFLRKPGAEAIIEDAAMTEFRKAGVSFDQLLALPEDIREQFKNEGTWMTYQGLQKKGETWENFIARYTKSQ